MLGLFAMLNWKMAALIADGCNGRDGEALPVVYVSGEEVCL